MKYIEITIETNEESLEAIAEKLAAAGITSVEIVDPAGIEELLWNTDPTEYADRAEFEEALAGKPAVRCYVPLADKENADTGIYIENIKCKVVDDADWKDKWKEYLVPVRVSDHVWVRPSWTDFEPEAPDEIVIAIDPGMAFGTGTHETTYLTMRLMEKYMKKGDLVLDVGCGSGILSIAAAKLGAGEVLGIDIDNEAVRTSNENILLNGVNDTVRAEYGDLTKGIGDLRADVVVANLLTPLVMALSEDVAKHLGGQGVYISSGILDEHRKRVVSHLEKLGFRVIETASEGGWCAVAAVPDRYRHGNGRV